MKFITLLIILFILLYNLILILGCGYIVFILGYSGWWFLLVYCFLLIPNTASTITSKLSENTNKEDNSNRDTFSS